MSSAEKKSWTNKFKDALDIKTVALAILILWTVGEKLWGYIEVGAKTEFNTEVAANFSAKEGTAFYNTVDSIFTIRVKDPKILGMILESEEVVKFSEEAGTNIRNAIIEDVMKQDTNKISMRSFLGMKTGLRDEDVLPKLAELLDAWKKGELMTKGEANSYVNRILRKEIKPGSLKRPTATF